LSCVEGDSAGGQRCESVGYGGRRLHDHLRDADLRRSSAERQRHDVVESPGCLAPAAAPEEQLPRMSKTGMILPAGLRERVVT